MMGPKPKAIEERFWPKVDRTGGPDACWPWLAYVQPNGYGEFGFPPSRDGKRNVFAHRVAFELANGPIPEGMVICHRCDNPRCVNPAHLFIGTQADNIRDMVSKGRSGAQKRTHCPNGHEIGGVFMRGGTKAIRYCVTCSRARAAKQYADKKTAS